MKCHDEFLAEKCNVKQRIRASRLTMKTIDISQVTERYALTASDDVYNSARKALGMERRNDFAASRPLPFHGKRGEMPAAGCQAA